MIARSSGPFQVGPLVVGALVILVVAPAAWKSARRKDLAEALKAAAGLVFGSWFVCRGLGVIPDGLFLAGLGTLALLIMGRTFLVNRRQALSQLGRSVLVVALLAVGVLGLRALGITRGPLRYAGLLVVCLLTAVVITFLQLRRGGGR
jgi:hypothetical protein